MTHLIHLFFVWVCWKLALAALVFQRPATYQRRLFRREISASTVMSALYSADLEWAGGQNFSPEPELLRREQFEQSPLYRKICPAAGRLATAMRQPPTSRLLELVAGFGCLIAQDEYLRHSPGTVAAATVEKLLRDLGCVALVVADSWRERWLRIGLAASCQAGKCRSAKGLIESWFDVPSESADAAST